MLQRKAKLEMEKTLTMAKFPYLIEITYVYNDDTEEQPHRDILRYANSDEDIDYTETVDGQSVTHTFSAGYFSLKLPQVTQSGFSDAKLTISAIDYSWIEKIRASQKRSKIRFIAVIDYDNNGNRSVEPIEDMEFVLTNATSDGTSIQWTMKFDDLMEIQVPYEECDDRVCPALV